MQISTTESPSVNLTKPSAPTRDIDEIASSNNDLIKRLRSAGTRLYGNVVRLDAAVELKVMPTSADWTPFPGMENVLTRVTRWDDDGGIVELEAYWLTSGSLIPHWHDEAEKITMIEGSMSLWLDVGSGPARVVELSTGDAPFNIPPRQAHSGYIHARTRYLIEFHPPFTSGR